MINPINNKGPIPELYTKYILMWCKAFTTRYISKKRHKKRIIGIWLFLFKANSPFLVEA